MSALKQYYDVMDYMIFLWIDFSPYDWLKKCTYTKCLSIFSKLFINFAKLINFEILANLFIEKYILH